MKLDNLDNYTRTLIKNEIATDRNNYITIQRTSIETGLNDKIQQKATLQEIKTLYDPIIKQIYSYFRFSVESIDFNNLYTLSQIISSDQNNKIISYFPAD